MSLFGPCCCTPPPLNLSADKGKVAAYRRVLWAVLAINGAMFLIEIGAGLAAGSASLQADASSVTLQAIRSA